VDSTDLGEYSLVKSNRSITVLTVARVASLMRRMIRPSLLIWESFSERDVVLGDVLHADRISSTSAAHRVALNPATHRPTITAVKAGTTDDIEYRENTLTRKYFDEVLKIFIHRVIVT